MATTTIPWGDGSGDNITLTYASASGNQTVTVSSDVNNGAERTKLVTFTAGSITQTLTVVQSGASNLTSYIRNSGSGAYIDTGIIPDRTTRVVVWARNFAPNGISNPILFGARESDQANSFACWAGSGNNVNRLGFQYGNSSAFYGNAPDAVTKVFAGYHKYDLSPGGVYVDDELLVTPSSANPSINSSLHLFGLNNAGTHLASASVIDICACKIYKNNVLVRDYTPVNYPSVGLYDSVSETLFTNSGAGSFTYGAFNNSAYVPIEYISCTNTQWFDTGIYGYRKLPAVCKFKTIGTSVANPSLFGTMNQGTSGTYYLLQLGNNSYKNRYCNLYINTSTSNQLYNNNGSKLTGRVVFFAKDTTTARLVENNSTIGSARTFSTESFTTPYTLAFATIKNNGAFRTAEGFTGNIYYAGFGSDRSFVPAKVNNIAGMYDTYNDVFYPSVTETAFGAGPEI